MYDGVLDYKEGVLFYSMCNRKKFGFKNKKERKTKRTRAKRTCTKATASKNF
jgi:hypothetical protein